MLTIILVLFSKEPCEVGMIKAIFEDNKQTQRG